MRLSQSTTRSDGAAALLKPRRLGHVNLFVSDLERAMAFYEDVAGFHEIFREPDIQAGFLSNGAAVNIKETPKTAAAPPAAAKPQ